MSSELLSTAYLTTGIVMAVIGGVFLAFSDFVMAGLLRAAPAGGMEVMQQINRTVFRSVFLASFLILVPVSMGMAIHAYFATEDMVERLVMTGTIVYVLGGLLVTIFGNVPMNEHLNKLPLEAEGIEYWREYGVIWTRWNHLRTIACIAGAVCFLLASRALGS